MLESIEIGVRIRFYPRPVLDMFMKTFSFKKVIKVKMYKLCTCRLCSRQLTSLFSSYLVLLGGNRNNAVTYPLRETSIITHICVYINSNGSLLYILLLIIILVIVFSTSAAIFKSYLHILNII